MAKQMKKKKKRGSWFGVGMLIYAIVFAVACVFGLNWLWGIMEGFENSRPQKAIDSYMTQLNAEYIVDRCDGLIAQVDHNIQSEEACRQVLKDALTGELTYARKASACTETKQVYVLRCGKQVVGSFTIQAGVEDENGFTAWHFSEDNFDLSYLMGTSVTATAPAGYPVYVNGVRLDERYVIHEEKTEYDVLDGFYENYDVPYFVEQTYEAGPFLGQFEILTKDPQGNAFVYDESFDKESLSDNCSEDEEENLDEFVEEFLDAYVLFAGCANDDRHNNYKKVIKYVVPESTLAQRIADSIDGLRFAQSRGDEIVDIDVHHYICLEEGRYMCDITYLVDTTGLEGVVRTTNNVKILIVETDGKLLVEAMTSY